MGHRESWVSRAGMELIGTGAWHPVCAHGCHSHCRNSRGCMVMGRRDDGPLLGVRTLREWVLGPTPPGARVLWPREAGMGRCPAPRCISRSGSCKGIYCPRGGRSSSSTWLTVESSSRYTSWFGFHGTPEDRNSDNEASVVALIGVSDG